MFVVKSPVFKKNSKAVVKYRNFKGINTTVDHNLLGGGFAINCYNLKFDSGALTEGLGADYYKVLNRKINALPFQPIKIYHYKRSNENGTPADKLICYCSDKFLYYIDCYDIGANFLKMGVNITFNEMPKSINYRIDEKDCIIFTSPQDSMMVWNGVEPPYYVESAPKIKSMCIHYERLFATVEGENDTLWFSDDLNPTNWNLSLDDAGYIKLVDERGSLNKVVDFLDYLYVFREYGIARLSAYGEQSQFSVNHLHVSSGKIYPESVAVCGDVIVFLAENGFFMFDGFSTKKILSGLDKMFEGIDNSKAQSCYFNGKYYLVFSGYVSKKVERMLLELNLETLSYYFVKDIPFTSLSKVSIGGQSHMAVTVDGNKAIAYLKEGADNFGFPLVKVFEMPMNDFGENYRKKILRRVSFICNHQISVFIDSDENGRCYKVEGSSDIINLPLNITGKMFAIKFKTSFPKVRIVSLNMCFDFIN